MPKISAEEKENATLIPLERILSDVDDTETSFNEFRESFQTGDEPGVVRAWELSIDDRGNVGTTKMQTKLGSWPIDAYRLDELCKIIVDQYMSPDQNRMAVRLVGTRKEQTGYVFNKIMLLKRAIKKESSSNGGESTGSLLKMMQENNERIIAMVQRLQPSAQAKDPMEEMQRMMAFAQMMNNPMNEMMKLLLPAIAGRPLPAAATPADPFTGLTGILDVAERIADMRGGGSGDGGDDNSFAGILKAITPLAKPALEALPAIAAMQAANRPAPRIIQAPQPVRAAPPPSAPTPKPAPAQAPAPVAATPPAVNPTQLTDLPSGDAAMLAQLKPQIDSLVQMAEQKSDPTGAADLIFDQVLMNPQLPDEIYEQLANFIDSENFVNYVGIINPAAIPHRNWFEAFKTQLINRLAIEEAPEPPANGASAGPVATG